MKQTNPIIHKILSFCIISYCFIYLSSCLTPFISPFFFFGFTFLALLFPYLLLGMVLILLLSILFFRKYSIFISIFILVGFKNIESTTGFHFNYKFNQTKEKETIRLLSWNVDNFVDNQKSNDTPNCPRRNILNFLKSMNADILCLQDYQDFDENKWFYSNLKYITDTLKFPYHYISVDNPFKGDYFPQRYGTAIFSKFPIEDSGRIAYPNKYFPEHLMYGKVKVNNRLLTLFTTHLQSMYLHHIYGKRPGESTQFYDDDTTIILYGNKYQKIKYFDSIHVQQAKLVKEQLNKCSLPLIFCADLNSVPSSYVYQHISSNLTDAFLQNGLGWGGTYSEIGPTLRIDVTLLSKELKTTQFYCPKLKNASDHYPLVTDILLK